MTLTKKSFSALKMHRILGHKRYEPIWYMMHKIRRVMSIRVSKYQLNGCIEFDERFFERVDNKDVLEDKKNTPTDTSIKEEGEARDKQRY